MGRRIGECGRVLAFALGLLGVPGYGQPALTPLREFAAGPWFGSCLAA